MWATNVSRQSVDHRAAAESLSWPRGVANENQLPPPKWYPDPNDPSRWRWWDGGQWTDHFAPRAGSGGTPGVAVTSATAAPEKRSRFARELIGNKDERAAARAERLTARAQATAMFRSRLQPSTQALSHQGNLPSIEQLLTELGLEAPRHPLDEQVEVAGETHHIAGIKKVFRGRSLPISARGTEISEAVCVLVPEPWNTYDSNAVVVAIDGQSVGHLPADVACDYARPLAGLANTGLLATGQARLWAKETAAWSEPASPFSSPKPRSSSGGRADRGSSGWRQPAMRHFRRRGVAPASSSPGQE